MRTSSATAFFAAFLLSTGAAFSAEKPTDPQIAHIAYTAGELDIKAAEQALDKSKTESVRVFANDMLRDHKAVNEKALALVKKLGVTPEDNDTSKALAKDADAKRAELAKLSGSNFDAAFARQMVADHEASIAKYRAHMQSDDEAVASYVRESLPELEGHLAMARQLQEK